MKSFLEWLSENDKEAYEIIDQALKKAGLKWDEDEFNVLYGKWVDMTVYISPGGLQRVQGVIYPEKITHDEDSLGPSGSGFEINNKGFAVDAIEEIHAIRVSETYDDILLAWEDDQDYERTLRFLPR
jgi:hypothetical protein